MTTHICAWCGRKCNNGWYRDSFIAHLPIIDDFSKAFCSRRCRSAFRNQRQRDKNQKKRTNQPRQSHSRTKERPIYIEPILSTEEFKPRTKEDIDLEFYEKQKELEFEQQKQALTQQQIEYLIQQRQAKYDNAKKYLESGGNKYVYYLKMLWAYLDKPWKKILFVLMIWWLIASLLSPLFKK